MYVTSASFCPHWSPQPLEPVNNPLRSSGSTEVKISTAEYLFHFAKCLQLQRAVTMTLSCVFFITIPTETLQ